MKREGYIELAPQSTWFTTNPWFDALLLCGLPSILLTIFAGHFHDKWFFPTIGNTFSSFFLGWPHITGSAVILYFDRARFKNKWFTYVLLPFLFVLVFTVAWVSKWGNVFSTLFFYLIIWHIIFQYLFIHELFFLTRQKYNFLDLFLGRCALSFMPIFTVLYSQKAISFQYQGKVTPIVVNNYALIVLAIVSIATLIIFCARQAFLYITHRKIIWFSVCMVLTANTLSMVPLLLFKNANLYILMTFRFLHSVQYIFFVFLYFRLRFKGMYAKESPLLSYFSKPNRFFIFYLFFLLFSCIVSYLLTPLLMRLSFAPAVDTVRDIVRILFHFYVDIILWTNSKSLARALT